jgi:type VI secretion system protein ImpA
LSSVRQLLEEIVAVTRQHLVKRGLIATGAGAADNDAAAAAVAGGEGQSQGGARGGVAGVIATRQDVVTAIDRICEFFERNEPSSPIPLLLLRARRLVSKSFAEVMRDLSPDALGTLSVISGTDLAAEPGSEGQ